MIAKLFRIVGKLLFALLFILGGVNHFIDPNFYLKMMPEYIPMHLEMIYISGVFEILLGLGLLIPKYSRLAAFGLILLLIAVFPANLNMALNASQFSEIPEIGLWVRLPVQFLLIWWAWTYTKKSR
ncbi:MAG: DoxX family protein [Proteobacteria bacterium]|nr:DoxX family protein [Pseudomonadota bacterium]